VGGVAVCGGLVGVERFVNAAEVEQGVAAIGRRSVIADGFGVFKGGDGLREAALAVEKNSFHVDGFILRGVDCKRAVEPLPCGGEVALVEMELAPGDEGFHLVRVEIERDAEMLFGSGGAATVAVERGKIDPCGDEIGAQRGGSAQRGFGVGFAALLAKQAAEVHPCSGEVGSCGDGATVAGFGFIDAAKAGKHEAGSELRFRHARMKHKRLVVVDECFSVPLEDGERIAETEMGGGERGLAIQREIELGDGVFDVSAGQMQFAEAEVGERVCAVEAQRLRVSLLGGGLPAGGLQCLAKRHPRGNRGRRDGHRGGGHLNGGLVLAAGYRDEAHADERLRVAGVGGERVLAGERDLGEVAGEVGLSCIHAPPDGSVVARNHAGVKGVFLELSNASLSGRGC